MPIEVESEIRVFGRDEFHTLAHQVLESVLIFRTNLGGC